MLKGHPKGLYVAFFTNMGERFGWVQVNRPHAIKDDGERQQVARLPSRVQAKSFPYTAFPHRLRHEDLPYGSDKDGARSWMTGVSMRIPPR